VENQIAEVEHRSTKWLEVTLHMSQVCVICKVIKFIK
jgi:hypothetical protein